MAEEKLNPLNPEWWEHEPGGKYVEINFTPRHWEIGLGFYFGCTFENNFTGTLTKSPSSLFLLLGPCTVTINFGMAKLFDKKIGET